MALPSGAPPTLTDDVAAGGDDAIERAAIDDQILDDREGPGAPRLDRDGVAVLEPAHVQLADGRAAIGPVRDAVDHQAAHAADAFAAVRVERDRVLALLDQPFVHDVEHLEKRHVGRDVVGRVVDQPARASGRPAARSSAQSHDPHERGRSSGSLVSLASPTCSSAASGALLRTPAAPCAAPAPCRRP